MWLWPEFCFIQSEVPTVHSHRLVQITFDHWCQRHGPIHTQQSSEFREIKQNSCDIWDVTIEWICTSILLVKSLLITFTEIKWNTVNSLMFAGINVCVFEAKPCLWGLIFAVSSGLVSFFGTWIIFAGYLFLQFKDGCEIHQINLSQILMNLQYHYQG